MSRIDISLGFNHYSPQELQNYASLGLISCNGVDLTEFVEKILEGMYSQEELDKAVEDAEESSDELSNVRESVREALAILEAIG